MTVERLASLVDRGAFGRVASLLVSRRGELVHESYQDDGGADALRDCSPSMCCRSWPATGRAG